MEYSKLGNTDIEVSKLCVGCMSFGKDVYKRQTICCTQGQNIYVEKRGENPPRYNQT